MGGVFAFQSRLKVLQEWFFGFQQEALLGKS
jgi:hypothetical protein